MRRKHFGKTILAAVLAAVMLTGCANSENTPSGSAAGGESSIASSANSGAVSSAAESASSAAPESSKPESSAPESSSASESSSAEEIESSTLESTPESAPESVPENSAPESSAEDNNSESTSGGSGEVSGSGAPFARHGALSVKGTDLVDEHGAKTQLRGMSTHGLAWFPQYVNYDTFKYLRDEWNTNCIRLAMYTYENGGYCSDGNKENLKSLVRNGVDYATQLGMYVIIDWHVLNDQNPLTYKNEAISFFDEMSKQYANNGNVIYEICNEPNSSASWGDITAYANEVIPVIRANSPNSVILVGTPTWSQEIDKAAAAPLSFNNVMYTLHFYAATHTDWLRGRMESCINGGLPVFVSEFGTCDASGNGAVDVGQSNAWKDLIERYNVSYMCWNLANKNESSSIIKDGCSKLYGWSDDELSTQGKWIRDWFVSETD